MKKVIAILIFGSLMLGSCAQSTNCPAYGTTRVDTPKVKRG